MGLRIVDWHRAPQQAPQITEQDRQRGLETATQDWLAARGGAGGAQRAEFLANFRKVRARLAEPTSMVEMATRIRENILGRPGGAVTPHNQVDIATLLELL